MGSLSQPYLEVGELNPGTFACRTAVQSCSLSQWKDGQVKQGSIVPSAFLLSPYLNMEIHWDGPGSHQLFHEEPSPVGVLGLDGYTERYRESWRCSRNVPLAPAGMQAQEPPAFLWLQFKPNPLFKLTLPGHLLVAGSMQRPHLDHKVQHQLSPNYKPQSSDSTFP